MENDLISRNAAIDALFSEGRNVGSRYPAERIICECDAIEAISMLPSAEPLTEEDYTELRDRFGEYVEFVVRDMITGKGERWQDDKHKRY